MNVFAQSQKSGASAGIIVLNQWNLGESDPGAVTGNISNPTTIDSVGGDNLTRIGSPFYTSSSAPGSSLAVNFNSSSGYSGSLASNLTNNFGIEAWVMPTAIPSNSSATEMVAFDGSSGANG